MADILAITGSVVAVVALATKVLGAVITFGLDWKDAPDEVRRFREELETLRITLSLTRVALEFEEAFEAGGSLLLTELGPDSPPDSSTKLMLESCRAELSHRLDRLKEAGQGGPLGWRRLKAALLCSRTRDAVATLCRQCDKLNNIISVDTAVLGTRTNKEIKALRTEQQEWHRSAADRKILDWLSTSDYRSQLSYSLDRKEEGTAQWLLKSPEFLEWNREAGRTLFCQGMPGAGKTLMMSTVVEYLNSQHGKDTEVGIAYLYCDFTQNRDQAAQRLLANLLRQLTEKSGAMPEELVAMYERHKSGLPPLRDLTTLFHAVAKRYSRTFILIDGLDECQPEDRSNRCFFHELSNLPVQADASLLVTSRVIPEIRGAFGDCIDITIRASDDDIRTYVENQSDRSRISWYPELREMVKTTVVEAADGMFLLAELHMRTLLELFTPGDIEDALRVLPRGEAGLDDTYHQAMQRIESQKATEKYAKKVLSWVVHAKRNLTGLELCHAFAVAEGSAGLNKKYLPRLEDLVSICGGLVSVDPRTSSVRLVHYTTQEFFERHSDVLFLNAHADIALTCVTYMTFDVFKDGFCSSDEEFEARLESNPFYHYASQNWGHHAFRLTPKLRKKLLELFQKEPSISAAT